MRITELFGIRHPLIQAPLAGAQGSALAIAVCEAGALGSLPCALLSVPQLAAELAAIRRGTPAPFNVNFFCHQNPTPDAARAALWHETLRPFYAEFGIDATDRVSAPARNPFDAAIAGTSQGLRRAPSEALVGGPDTSDQPLQSGANLCLDLER